MAGSDSERSGEASMSADQDLFEQHCKDIGEARFHAQHWRERLAVAMVKAAVAGMDRSEVERRSGGELTLPKAETMVRHIADCTVKKHHHLRLDKHDGEDLAAFLGDLPDEPPTDEGEGLGRTVRVRITDGEALSEVAPESVRAYLADTGWQMRPADDDPYITRMGSKATVWWRPCPEGEGDYEVLAPSDQSFKDCAIRMGELIRTLSIAEGRSEMDVLVDLLAGGGSA